ncbi:ATP-binding protein [Enorma phocaeensis]|uniref:ATP-binding protein n=1 Tax=Enorma phocaeensis TaxID=1871019 RepID=UPI0023526067|nr:ATP-binding protein [Enorma phocaeensis]
MTADELSAAILEMRRLGSETDRFEAKKCESNLSKDVWESVSAFANTAGGVLFLGLDENKGFTVAPKFNPNSTLDQFVSGMGDGGKDGIRVENPPQYKPFIMEYENAQLLVIEIEESLPAQKPCHIAGRSLNTGSFKRVWNKDVPLSTTELFELQNIAVRSNADRMPVAKINDLDNDLVAHLLERKEGSRALRGTKTIEEKLKRLAVVDGNGDVTLAGLIALGSYPQEFFSKLVVDVAVFPDNEKSVPGAPRFIDRVVADGTFVEMANEAVEAIMRNLRRIAVIRGTGRAEEPEIPREVLREAVVNALVHREYDSKFLGRSVDVNVYPNRVEITSPGGLWGTRTKHNLAEGVSECRNDALMSLIKDLVSSSANAPLAEGNGSGIPYIYNEMKRHTLRPPTFAIGFDSFSIILGRFGTEIAENQRWISERTSQHLSRDEEAILLLARDHEEITVQDAHMNLGVDSDEARAMLVNLCSLGLLKPQGDDAYRLIKATRQTLSDSRVLTDTQTALCKLLDETEAKSSQELAASLGKTPRTVQRALQGLLDKGIVIATAPRTNKERKYLLSRDLKPIDVM